MSSASQKIGKPLRIGLSRSDSIGDVVISLTTAAYLKQVIHCEIVFIHAAYTEAVVKNSPFVDERIVYDAVLPLSVFTEKLVEANLDYLIHLFPVKAIARAGQMAEIPNRIGTSHRWWNWLYCNRRPSFSRKNSNLHEGQLNLKLLGSLGVDTLASVKVLEKLSKLNLPDIGSLADTVWGQSLDNWVVLHPKSKGSARDWPLEHYKDLAALLHKSGFKVMVCGTASEGELIRKELLGWLDSATIFDMTGKLTLEQYMAVIGRCAGLIACSTGPLHIAAALGVRALGLYPGIRPMHPGRWAPLGLRADYLVWKDDCRGCANGGTCACMAKLEPQLAFDTFLKL